ncbi:MAG TPA: ferrous iron transport protein B [Methanomassiliicoccales archaeon]|nr:ferrous iron transport protein B [Methanomassiliicoccales archaeon]
MEIGLIGQPNVGKSVLFSRLTGIGVISSNYPGTTVEFQEGAVVHHGKTLNFHDLPGTYSLAGGSEDEEVATRLLAEKELDVVVVVIDASRLEQGLVLLFQLIELGFRVVVALNMMDIARKRFTLDVTQLEEWLRVPIVPTVALTGEGVEQLVEELVKSEFGPSTFSVRYDRHIEDDLKELSVGLGDRIGKFPIRGGLIKLLEGNPFFTEQFPQYLLDSATQVRRDFEREHGEDISIHISRDRYGEAGRVAKLVIAPKPEVKTRADRISALTIRPTTGIPIMLAVLAGLFVTIVFVGGFLENVLLTGYHALVGSFFVDVGRTLGGDVGIALGRGVDLSIQAIMAIVIPYIIVFYLMLGIIEDTGYLPRVVVLLDGVMHKIGLNGRAIIPMIVGMGCNVPAILATRVMESRRERLILATITVMAVPCSAQTAVIIGTVGNNAGYSYAILIYLILLAILLVLGRVLHKVMRYEPASLALEIPDLTVPRWRNVLYKTKARSKDFFSIAFPILLVGSLVLEVLMQFNVLEALVGPLSPLTVGLLGLPPVMIVALIFGILRKEMALQLLVVLFGTSQLYLVLNPEQLFVFALVMATYMPCLAAFAAMTREFGLKDALKVVTASVVLAFALGGVAHFLFHAL